MYFYVNKVNQLYSNIVDGHHKLIKWRFCTHAGIDGYSRMIVYMKCSTNNEAATVLNAFIRGLEKYVRATIESSQ